MRHIMQRIIFSWKKLAQISSALHQQIEKKIDSHLCNVCGTLYDPGLILNYNFYTVKWYARSDIYIWPGWMYQMTRRATAAPLHPHVYGQLQNFENDFAYSVAFAYPSSSSLLSQLWWCCLLQWIKASLSRT